MPRHNGSDIIYLFSCLAFELNKNTNPGNADTFSIYIAYENDIDGTALYVLRDFDSRQEIYVLTLLG